MNGELAGIFKELISVLPQPTDTAERVEIAIVRPGEDPPERDDCTLILVHLVEPASPPPYEPAECPQPEPKDEYWDQPAEPPESPSEARQDVLSPTPAHTPSEPNVATAASQSVSGPSTKKPSPRQRGVGGKPTREELAGGWVGGQFHV